MRVGQAEILTAAEELYRFTRDKSSSNNLISYIRGLNRKPRKFFDVVVKEIIVSEDDNHQAEEMIIDQPEELEPSYTGSFIHASDDESEYDEITGDILMKEYEKALIKAGGLDDENFKNFIERYIEKLKDEN